MKTCIHSSVVPTLLALGFSFSSASGEWTSVTVGIGVYDIILGAGRNDGISRIYTGGDWREFTWSGSSWTNTSVFGVGIAVPGVALGAARRDGIMRIYCSNGYNDGEVAEFTYAGGIWNYSKSVSYPRANDIVVGSGRNDGVERVYAANDYLGEYTWNSSTTSYLKLALPSPASKVNQLEFGDGRNDGVRRLYGVTTGGQLSEWSYNGSWVKTEVNLGLGSLTALSIGIARLDGVKRIYAACADGHVYELSWLNSEWTPLSIGYGALEMTAVNIGTGRNDGMPCVYAGNNDRRLYEFRHSNGAWSSSSVVLGPDRVTGIAVGPGRGDGVNRVYATFNGSLREYTYTPTTNPPFAAQLLPNGILEWSSVPGGVYDVEWSSDLTTWRSDWSTLTGIPATGTSTQKPIPRFFRVKQRTE